MPSSFFSGLIAFIVPILHTMKLQISASVKYPIKLTLKTNKMINQIKDVVFFI